MTKKKWYILLNLIYNQTINNDQLDSNHSELIFQVNHTGQILSCVMLPMEILNNSYVCPIEGMKSNLSPNKTFLQKCGVVTNNR